MSLCPVSAPSTLQDKFHVRFIAAFGYYWMHSEPAAQTAISGRFCLGVDCGELSLAQVTILVGLAEFSDWVDLSEARSALRR